MSSSVNHPPHYQTAMGLEAITVIEAFGLGFNLGNAVKYILRADKKGRLVEDLEKAKWYLQREIDALAAATGDLGCPHASAWTSMECAIGNHGECSGHGVTNCACSCHQTSEASQREPSGKTEPHEQIVQNKNESEL